MKPNRIIFTWLALLALGGLTCSRAGGAAPQVVPSLAGLRDAQLTGVARGDVLYRGAARWNNLHAGTSGQVLTSGGAGANPSWTTITSYTDAQAQSASGWARAAGVISPNTASDRILVNYAPPGSANYGLLSLGAGAFDGTTAGFFAGSAAGTHLGINAASGYTGNFADWQLAGAARFAFTGAGKFGVGTGSPAEKIDIANGNLRFSVLAAPTAPTAALAGLGAGNCTNGTHTFKVTFVTAAGQTTLGSASNSINVTNNAVDGQIALTGIPVDPAGVATSRRVYMTQAGGGVYFFLATLANNTTTTLTANSSDATLGAAASAPSENTATGWVYAGASAVLSTPANSVVLGSGSGNSLNRSGTFNTFLGALVGSSVTSGGSNLGVGAGALNALTTGSSNSAGGATNALVSVTTGSQNTAWGGSSADGLTTGSNNVALGYQSGHALTTGSNNILLGYRAGYNIAASATHKLYIGNADGSTTGAPLIYGDESVPQVAIGTTAPSAAAILQLNSTSMGLLSPRMTTAQRDAISSPPEGLWIWNTDTHVPNVYNGTSWKAVTIS